MQTIVNALKGTPWWVYVLFFYLLFIGIKALKPAVVSLKKMFILPIIFIAWSLYNLITELYDPLHLGFWIVSLAAGTLLGWLMIRSFPMKADKKKNLITTQGGPSTLILILLIFSTKYFFGYYTATHPEAMENLSFVFFRLAASGLITGMFVGKALCIGYKYKKSDHTDLKKTA